MPEICPTGVAGTAQTTLNPRSEEAGLRIVLRLPRRQELLHLPLTSIQAAQPSTLTIEPLDPCSTKALGGVSCMRQLTCHMR